MISSNWDKDGGWRDQENTKKKWLRRKKWWIGLNSIKSSTKREIKDPFSEAEITYDLKVWWCQAVISKESECNGFRNENKI